MEAKNYGHIMLSLSDLSFRLQPGLTPFSICRLLNVSEGFHPYPKAVLTASLLEHESRHLNLLASMSLMIGVLASVSVHRDPAIFLTHAIDPPGVSCSKMRDGQLRHTVQVHLGPSEWPALALIFNA